MRGCLDCYHRLGVMRFEAWPPPSDWTEVVIKWQTMLDHADYRPNAIEWWCQENVQGRWHLHGYQQTEGFAFRFEDPRDAVLFRLRWSCD